MNDSDSSKDVEIECQGKTGMKVLAVTASGTVPYYGSVEIEVPSDATDDDFNVIFDVMVENFGAPINALDDELAVTGDDLCHLELDVTELAIDRHLSVHPRYRACRDEIGWIVTAQDEHGNPTR